MEPFVIEFKPYSDDDTIIYITNSKDIVDETSQNIWVPYSASNSDGSPLWLFTKEDSEYDYMKAYLKLNKKTKYGIHSHNINSISFLTKTA